VWVIMTGLVSLKKLIILQLRAYAHGVFLRRLTKSEVWVCEPCVTICQHVCIAVSVCLIRYKCAFAALQNFWTRANV
jgi:hypothetical protein